MGSRPVATSGLRGQACDAACRELALDMAQMAIDIAGIVDPTPIADGTGAILAVSRGNWTDAAFNVVGLIPYIGDLAKAGKLPRYMRTIETAADMVRTSPAFARRVAPVIERLDQALRLLPDDSATVIAMRRQVSKMLQDVRVTSIPAALPDISRQFKFREFNRGRDTVKEASGRLGIPGQVKSHRSQSAQRGVSAGTGDDAGHLIGARFGAPPDARNLSLQNWKANRFGTFKNLEDAWAAKLRGGTGISIRVQDVTRAGEARPYWRKVEWTEIDAQGNITRHELDFMNATTPKSRAATGDVNKMPDGHSATIHNLDDYR